MKSGIVIAQRPDPWVAAAYCEDDDQMRMRRGATMRDARRRAIGAYREAFGRRPGRCDVWPDRRPEGTT